MIIVSNTSPLTSLAAVGRFHLLPQLFSELHISEAVWDELNAEGGPWPGRDEVATASWILRHPKVNDHFVRTLLQTIDRGEAESIALAVRLGADLILLDDRDARAAAEH